MISKKAFTLLTFWVFGAISSHLCAKSDDEKSIKYLMSLSTKIIHCWLELWLPWSFYGNVY